MLIPPYLPQSHKYTGRTKSSVHYQIPLPDLRWSTMIYLFVDVSDRRGYMLMFMADHSFIRQCDRGYYNDHKFLRMAMINDNPFFLLWSTPIPSFIRWWCWSGLFLRPHAGTHVQKLSTLIITLNFLLLDLRTSHPYTGHRPPCAATKFIPPPFPPKFPQNWGHSTTPGILSPHQHSQHCMIMGIYLTHAKLTT